MSDWSDLELWARLIKTREWNEEEEKRRLNEVLSSRLELVYLDTSS